MKPTVVHVLEAYAGGTERHLNDLVQHMCGFEHVLAVPPLHHARSTAAAARTARNAGARVELVEMGRLRDAHRNLAGAIRLRRMILRRRADLIHAHSSIGGAVARLARLWIDVPLVYTPNGLSRLPWAMAVERSLPGRFDRLIAVSASEREFAIKHRIATRDEVVVVPNGIDLTPPPPLAPSLRSRLGVPDGTPLVGCVGRLAWQKAPEVYIAACARVHRRLPDVRFVLVGSGPLKDSIDGAVRDAGLDGSFRLLPSLPTAAAALAELDVYVLPSRFEGGPYTPLEAMRGGTPVIVTDADGNRDTVSPGVSGLIVGQDDPEALAGAIERVLGDPVLRAKLIAGGRAALPRFDVRTMARATAEVYNELLTSRPARQRR